MMVVEFDRYIATGPDHTWVIWDVREGMPVDLANIAEDKLMSYISKEAVNEEKTIMMASNAGSADQNHHAKMINGTVRLFDSKTDQEIAQFITYTDGEWIVITPEGYYNASPNGGKHLNARIGTNVYGIENYSEDYFRPDLVKAALANVCPEQGVTQSAEPAIEHLKWATMVTNTEAIFTFPETNREEWSWYNTDTPANRMEYGWNVSIGDHESGYQFGPMLFNPGDSKQTTGSLSHLLRRCQHGLWLVSKDGGENIGSYGNATVVDRRVQVKISDKELIEKLFETKPTTVYMTLVTPEFTSRRKITVEYETQE